MSPTTLPVLAAIVALVATAPARAELPGDEAVPEPQGRRLAGSGGPRRRPPNYPLA